MAKYKKTGTLDGYSTIKAIARTAKPHPPEQPKDGAPAAPAATHHASKPTDLRELGAHVARTVVPKKHIVECYECGYSFQLHGRAKQVNCSKCKLTLDLTDHVLGDKWSDTLKTAGDIHLTPTGILQSGKLIAKNIILEGTIEGGSVKAMQRLTIGADAIFPEKAIAATDLRIEPNAALVFKQPATFRDVELLGAFNAHILVKGRMVIRASGLFEGDLTTAHLEVEEGGGLRAQLRIGVPVEKE